MLHDNDEYCGIELKPQHWDYNLSIAYERLQPKYDMAGKQTLYNLITIVKSCAIATILAYIVVYLYTLVVAI